MSNRVAILGAGSWGLAIGGLLTQQGCAIKMWEYNRVDFQRLLTTRSNPDKLADFKLADGVELTADPVDAVADVDVVVVAVSSQHVRSVISQLRNSIGRNTVVVNLAKGIERGSLERMSEVIAGEAGIAPYRVATLSGPSHAEEVARNMPTTVAAASVSDELAVLVQEMFSSEIFRVYKSSDVVGVELGGSLKNIIAIAAGIVDGLELGDNTKGALITRGLAEITRLGVALGARPETFAGLSGLGDLVTTCFSKHSRNRFVGEQLGIGRKLDEVLTGMTMIAEGVETTRSGRDLARRHDVEMPITEEVYRVLFEDKQAREALGNLMERRLRSEIWQ